MIEGILLIVGFCFLIKGADFFVEGAANIAKIFKVPSIVIGLTIVAMGTSLPELAVSASASMKGANAIAIGNVVGSNIANLLFIGGVCAIICPIVINKVVIKRDVPFTFVVKVILLLFCFDFFIGNNGFYISNIEGIILLIIFVLYLIMLFSGEKNNENEVEKPKDSLIKSLLFSVVGAIAILYGGNLVVNSSVKIAEQLGMSQNLIGLTIVAFGTSLPELVTSVVAALKKEADIAIGNIIGSNIFNILFVLGVSALINPIAVDPTILFDTLFMISTMVLFYFITFKSHKLSRRSGALLVVLYVFYTTYITIRN